MNSKNTQVNAYFDGEYCQSSDIKIGILSNSLNYGTWVIESIRVYKKDWHYYTIGLNEYLRRFITAIETKWFKLEIEIKDIIRCLQILLGKNQDYKHPYFRLVWFIGDDSINTMSTDSHFAIVFNDLYVPDMGWLNACFSSFLRLKSSLHKLKLSSNYARNIIEQNKARKNWFNYVIFLWEDWEILEWLSENIFLKVWDTIITPETGNILSGVNRHFIIDSLKKSGIQLIEKKVSQEEILKADGVIVSGSATWVRQLSGIEQSTIDSSSLYELVSSFYWENMDVENPYITKLL